MFTTDAVCMETDMGAGHGTHHADTFSTRSPALVSLGGGVGAGAAALPLLSWQVWPSRLNLSPALYPPLTGLSKLQILAHRSS